MCEAGGPQNWRMGHEKFYSLKPIGSEMDLKELMRLCYNAGFEDVDGFQAWWDELGEDRHDDFVRDGADPEMLDVMRGLLRTLEAVIETANESGLDFVKGDVMKWGALANELIQKLES